MRKGGAGCQRTAGGGDVVQDPGLGGGVLVNINGFGVEFWSRLRFWGSDVVQDGVFGCLVLCKTIETVGGFFAWGEIVGVIARGQVGWVSGE